jgi:hypothetical protein
VKPASSTIAKFNATESKCTQTERAPSFMNTPAKMRGIRRDIRKMNIMASSYKIN